MVALGVIGISALTIKYINSNDTLVLLRDNNGDAQLSDEQKELKDLTVATQGGAWWNILYCHCHECYSCCRGNPKQIPNCCCEF